MPAVATSVTTAWSVLAALGVLLFGAPASLCPGKVETACDCGEPVLCPIAVPCPPCSSSSSTHATRRRHRARKLTPEPASDEASGGRTVAYVSGAGALLVAGGYAFGSRAVAETRDSASIASDDGAFCEWASGLPPQPAKRAGARRTDSSRDFDADRVLLDIFS